MTYNVFDGTLNFALSIYDPIFLWCFDTVGWVFWHVKPVISVTHSVFGGTLDLTQLDSVTQTDGLNRLYY